MKQAYGAGDDNSTAKTRRPHPLVSRGTTVMLIPAQANGDQCLPPLPLTRAEQEACFASQLATLVPLILFRTRDRLVLPSSRSVLESCGHVSITLTET